MADTQCTSEGQVGRLYKYNGLSPRMFHAAWHFHYLKPPHPSPYRLKSATNVHAMRMPRMHLTARRPLMILG